MEQVRHGQGGVMNQSQIVALVYAYTDLQRLIAATDSENVSDMQTAREFALCSLVDLAREFPIVFGAQALEDMRQLRDSVIFAGRPKT
jgi:hypothetical protein